MTEPNVVELIERSNQTFAEFARKQDETIERLQKTSQRAYEVLGIDADGEAKHNLKEMAGKIADIETALEKSRRIRTHAASQPSVAKAVFDNPVDQARHEILSSPEYKMALGRLLRREEKSYDHADPDYQFARLKALPASLDGRYSSEVKSGLSADFDSGAGFFAPPQMDAQISKLVVEMSPLATFARTVTIGTGRYEGLIRNPNRDQVRRVGEREARPTATQTKRYEKRGIPVHEVTVDPALTSTLLEDSQVDVVGELMADAGEDFAVDKGRQLVKGTGDEEAMGIMVSDLIGSINSGVADNFTTDSLIRLRQSIKTNYKANARYLFSREALTELMLKREDTGAGPGTGAYIWMPTTRNGEPSTVWGDPWAEMIDMDAVAANSHPIIYGDFSRAYRVVERRGLRIVRDELTQRPYIVFAMTQRFGGDVWIGEAAKKLKLAA